MIDNQQVKVKFSIGNYEDSVLCDIEPMETCHLLLGRPWHFGKEITHNGHTNEITFTQKDKRFVLHPLTPSQVVEDQVQMREEIDKTKNKDTSTYISDIKCSKCQRNTINSK